MPSKPRTIDIPNYVPFLLNRAGVDFEELAQHVLRPYRLTLPMWRILAALSHSGDQRLSDLATAISGELSNISKVAQVMERRGLISRKRSNSDRRALSLHLTKAGVALVEKLVPVHLANEKRVLTGLAPDETDQLKRLLRIVHENARRILDAE